MKTHREIVIEAQRLEEAGRQFADEHRRTSARRISAADAFCVLFAFPESRFTSHFGGVGDGESVHTHRCFRRIEAAIVGDALEYRLLQDEIETTAPGAVVQAIGPMLMLTSDSAAEVLEEGYECAEQERLSEVLAPFMERAEAGKFVESVEPQLVEEIEAIVGAGDLLPAARLHMKSDIVKLLDGRIEPDEFITAAIARQRHREVACEIIAERRGERVLIDQP